MTTLKTSFTKYQVFIIVLLALMQFTVILDFMVLAPLGTILIKELHVTTGQFSLVVSAYALSAGVSGLLAAGFADKFDRKKLLLFFYAGFILGTSMCAWAPTYHMLLIARTVTGVFGGVIGSIGFAIITDLFPMELRGRVMGFVQMAFSASQVLGIPLGLYLAEKFDWHMPFVTLVGFSVLVVLAIVLVMKPLTAHIAVNKHRNPLQHLVGTVSNTNYLKGFAATLLLATGGFMMMPFGSTFATNNLGVAIEQLPFLYVITGVFSIFFGPIIGRISDKAGKFQTFVFGSIVTIVFVGIYTQLGLSPFWLVVVLNILLFVGISSRMISASALTSAVPAPQDRGAYMSINASLQQFSGAFASMIAGKIVYQSADEKLQNYPILGFVVIAAMIIAIFLMRMLNRMIQRNPAGKAATVQPEPDASVVDTGLLDS